MSYYCSSIFFNELQKEVTTLQGHSGMVYSVAFSPDGEYLASGSDDYTVNLWSVKS
jgi:WD40 repeat protein